MGNKICHFEIISNDMQKSMAFYKELFDWEITYEEQMNYGMINTGEDIGGGIMEKTEHTPPMLTYYILVDDVDKYLEKVTELGGEAIMPKTEIPSAGWIGMFKDLDGHVMGVYEAAEKE